jgi:hypothetical protein
VADWAIVRELLRELPEVEPEESAEGPPRFRVRGKLFAWQSRERDGGALAVRVDPDEKHLILRSNPDVYFETPHYHGYPAVLIRLEAIDRRELKERLEDAWLTRVPKRVAAAYLRDSSAV